MANHLENVSDRPTRAGWTAGGGDVLAAVMDAVRLHGQVFCRSELRAPWGMALRASDFAHFHIVERGGAWLAIEGTAPMALAGGDVVVVPHGAGHTLTDAPASPTRPLAAMVRRARAGGGCAIVQAGGRGAETHLVCGAFRFEHPDAHPLVALLPAVIHLRPQQSAVSEWLQSTVRFLLAETREPRPGTEAVVSRLTDVIFVQVLRAWIETLAEGRGGWLGALRDRQMGAALARLHEAPERPWTTATLAGAVGMSRSRFAARFTALVGQPPLTYLSRWRLQRAARLLEDPALSLGDVAARVGYESESAFSKAFRRRYGAPPGAYRRRAA